jgi:predicted nucleic acid-binding protein
VLIKPRQVGDATIERIYRDLLLDSRHFILLPIDVAIAESAADLRARYHLRTPDALQIAAALRAGCEAFVTNDATLRRVADLRVLVLDQLTL